VFVVATVTRGGLAAPPVLPVLAALCIGFMPPDPAVLLACFAAATVTTDGLAAVPVSARPGGT